MSKNLRNSAQETVTALADAIDQMIATVESHDYSKPNNLLAVSEMAGVAAGKTGLDKLLLQLTFSAVINGTSGEQAFHTLQGRYGGVKPGEKKEPKTAKVSEKKQLQAKVAELQAKLAEVESAKGSESDEAPDTVFQDMLEESVG